MTHTLCGIDQYQQEHVRDSSVGAPLEKAIADTCCTLSQWKQTASFWTEEHQAVDDSASRNVTKYRMIAAWAAFIQLRSCLQLLKDIAVSLLQHKDSDSTPLQFAIRQAEKEKLAEAEEHVVERLDLLLENEEFVARSEVNRFFERLGELSTQSFDLDDEATLAAAVATAISEKLHTNKSFFDSAPDVRPLPFQISVNVLRL